MAKKHQNGLKSLKFWGENEDGKYAHDVSFREKNDDIVMKCARYFALAFSFCASIFNILDAVS